MKNYFPLLSLLLAVLLITNCKEEHPKETTVLGFLTPFNLFPETVKGQVKDVKEQNYWATEKDGKIVAGSPITIADRDSVSWTNDFFVSFTQSGLVEKSVILDENEKALSSWEVTISDNKIISAARIVNDTIKNYINVIPQNESIKRREFINAITDTLISVVEVSYDEKGNYSMINFLNFKKEPTATATYSYNPEGFLNGYTWARNDTIRGGMNFTANQQGFVETQEVYNKTRGTSSLHRYEYEYDEMGNWIKCIAFTDNKAKIVAKRVYNYY